MHHLACISRVWPMLTNTASGGSGRGFTRQKWPDKVHSSSDSGKGNSKQAERRSPGGISGESCSPHLIAVLGGFHYLTAVLGGFHLSIINLRHSTHPHLHPTASAPRRRNRGCAEWPTPQIAPRPRSQEATPRNSYTHTHLPSQQGHSSESPCLLRANAWRGSEGPKVTRKLH